MRVGHVRFASQSLAEGLQTLSRGAAIARPGVLIVMRGDEPNTWERWNPRSRKMGEQRLVFCTHNESGDGMPLIEPLERVDHFHQALQGALDDLENASPELATGDIILEAVLGLPALLYNESRLGEWRERGSIAF